MLKATDARDPKEFSDQKSTAVFLKIIGD